MLMPILAPYGFEFRPEYADFSSAGPFANGFFISERLRIGLIVRAKRGLGSVNYEAGEYQAPHNELLRALGVNEPSELQYDDASMSSHARGGGEPFAALAHDLQDHFLPIWRDRPDYVELTIRSLRESWLKKLGVVRPQPNSR
jgi:hypothetical protein